MSSKKLMLKWTHPEWFDYIVTDLDVHHEEIVNSYACLQEEDNQNDILDLKVEIVSMTIEDIDRLPEFQG